MRELGQSLPMEFTLARGRSNQNGHKEKGDVNRPHKKGINPKKEQKQNLPGRKGK